MKKGDIMIPIYENENFIISYDGNRKEADIQQKGSKEKPLSFEIICMPKSQSRGTWDNIVNFVLRECTWTWIKVKHGDPNSTQIINITSIANQLNMKPEDILDLNNQGTLYETLCKKEEDAIDMHHILKEGFLTLAVQCFHSYQKAYGIQLKYNFGEFDGIPMEFIEDRKAFYKENKHHERNEVRHLIRDNFTRTAVAKALKSQEDQVLAQIPNDVLSDPEDLRIHLVKLLNEKGLSYEKAVKQFDWSSGRPQKVIEGSYVIAKLIAQTDFWMQLRSKKGTENFPFQEIWRFSIDGSKEKFGSYIFENEPFYILSSLRGLKEILESQEPLCQNTYETYATALMRNPPILHHKIHLEWKDAWLCDKKGLEAFFETKMVNRAQGFNISYSIQDPIGLSDVKGRTDKVNEAKKDTKEDKQYWITNATGFYLSDDRLEANTKTSHALIMNRIFLGRDQMLNQSKTPGERLMAYIWAARELELTHQLPDGNGRTSISTLIKWIAEDKELPNYIPENPNILDFQSPEAILRQVYSGMLRFKELSYENTAVMIDVETLVDQAGVRNQNWNIVHGRAELPDEIISKLVAEDRKGKPVSK